MANRSDNLDPKNHPVGNAVKDPENWTTGNESMTGAQASYLKTLCEEAGEEFSSKLTKAQASERIDALQRATGRGHSSVRDAHQCPEYGSNQENGHPEPHLDKDQRKALGDNEGWLQ